MVLNNLSKNIDRCSSTKCREGETCILNKDGDAECACITQCEDPKDERLMVCTKANHTYTSDCEFYQMQCWCRKNDQRCTRKEALIDSIDYFGRCQSKKLSRFSFPLPIYSFY
jgi:hypothetical protein